MPANEPQEQVQTPVGDEVAILLLADQAVLRRGARATVGRRSTDRRTAARAPGISRVRGHRREDRDMSRQPGRGPRAEERPQRALLTLSLASMTKITAEVFWK
jgi:hypothetical protein